MANARFVEVAQEPPSAEVAAPAQAERAGALSPRRSSNFRGGFSTSICSLFADPTRRNDCCSLALCGILSTDRSRYLLSQETPSWLWRIIFQILLPFGLFFADRAVAENMYRKQIEDGCNDVFDKSATHHEAEISNLYAIHVLLLLSLGIVLLSILIVSRTKRAKFRAELMSRVSEQSSQQISSDGAPRTTVDEVEMMRANRAYDCCYSAPDRMRPFSASSEPALEEDGDMCGCIWRTLAALCCASCCGCWCQCCGMCAAGQEEREVNTLVPKEEQMIDYITFESFASYFPSLEHLRRTQERNFSVHFCTLSQLSSIILKGATVLLACAFVLALTDIDAKFTFENMLVLIATILQAMAVLYFVHWRWHRFDLSLDAVIKYFASGFVIATSLAMVIEVIVSMAISIFSFVLFFVATLFELSLSERLEEELNNDPSAAMRELLKENTWVFVLLMFLNAFVVAALTEELCKYFSFWMVEHPDLMRRDDTSAGQVVDSLGGTNQEGAKNSWSAPEIAPELIPQSSEKSLNSTGTGITIAMVAAATGFACCENIGYVFSFTNKVDEELFILLTRSLMPVHAIAAAIQSIGVCRRDLEGDRTHKLGRIVFPAVLLHGSFDFVLMVIPMLEAIRHVEETDESAAEAEKECQLAEICKKFADNSDVEYFIEKMNCEDNDSSGTSWMDILGLFLAVLFLILSVVYYMVQSRAQKRRLDALDSGRGQSLGRVDNTVV